MKHAKRKTKPNTFQQSTPTSSTTPNQTPNAASTVFGIFELLENILLRLPLESILLVSNTCNSARQVVENSKPIINRFIALDDGYEARARLVEGTSWSDDIAFAFRFDLPGSPFTRVFVSQRGEHEAIAVRNSVAGGMKIVNGVNMKVTFLRTAWDDWEAEVVDAGTGRSQCRAMEVEIPCLGRWQYAADLARYLVRFHGGTGYEDSDDIVMKGRLVRGRVHL